MRNPRYTRPISYEEWAEHDGMLNAPHLIEERHEELLQKGINRAGGDCVCGACGKTYYDHPGVVGALWATELCDGTLVKL